MNKTLLLATSSLVLGVPLGAAEESRASRLAVEAAWSFNSKG